MLQEVIEEYLRNLVDMVGVKIPIPPRTGDMIEERRSMKALASLLEEDFMHQHTGWKGLTQGLEINDLMTRLLLCRELSEIWEVPMSFFMAFDMRIYSEPARMYVGIHGMMPLVYNGKSTPSLLRVAWDGALAGLWDVEDVWALPAPIEPVNPEDAVAPQELAVWFAGAE